MRAKYRLDQPEAARRLALTLGQLKVLEMRTAEVPPEVLDVIDVLLGPPPKFTRSPSGRRWTSSTAPRPKERRVVSMRETRDLRRTLARPRLLESPLVALRRRYGLTPSQTAELLGVSVLAVARLEAATRRLPAGVLATITERLTPPERLRQLTIMDHLDAIIASGEHAPTVGEGRCDA